MVAATGSPRRAEVHRIGVQSRFDQSREQGGEAHIPVAGSHPHVRS